jgi:hypothetical protein
LKTQLKKHSFTVMMLWREQMLRAADPPAVRAWCEARGNNVVHYDAPGLSTHQALVQHCGEEFENRHASEWGVILHYAFMTYIAATIYYEQQGVPLEQRDTMAKARELLAAHFTSKKAEPIDVVAVNEFKWRLDGDSVAVMLISPTL